MTNTILVALSAVVVWLLWASVRRWHERSDARRLARGRAMVGDTDLPNPDHESTLAISVAAAPPAVWDALLRLGWPREGHRWYERLGRQVGFLQPAGSAPAGGAAAVPIGTRSEIPVRAVVPTRTLVLGGSAGTPAWTWQFEIAALDERHTRIILRDRARRGAGLGASISLSGRRAVSFVLTRKMLLDIKAAAEAETRTVALPLTR